MRAPTSTSTRGNFYNSGRGIAILARAVRLPMIILSVLLLSFSSISSAIALGEESYSLSLTLAPETIRADGSTEPALFVQMIGKDGRPTLAPSDLQVSLSSSDRSVATTPSEVVILQGASYALVPVTSTVNPGTSLLSAHRPGSEPVSVPITTFSGLGGTKPFTLALSAAPNPIIAASEPGGEISVSIVGANGRLVFATEDMVIRLATSNPDAIRFQETVTILKGSHYGVAAIQPISPGSAVISAVYPGFESEFMELHVTEPGGAPVQLRAFVSPLIMLSDSDVSGSVIIHAVDEEGRPTYFPCTQVRLASSIISMADVPKELMPQCQEAVPFIRSQISSGAIRGTAAITAAADGLRPNIVRFEVQGAPAYQLKVTVAPTFPLKVESDPGVVVIQLIDAEGRPTRTRSATLRIANAEGTILAEHQIPDSDDFLRLPLNSLMSLGTMALSFSSPGLPVIYEDISLIELPLSITALNDMTRLAAGNEREVMFRVESSGVPLAGADVSWHVVGGSLKEAVAKTDESGYARAVFIGEDSAEALVTISASKVGHQLSSVEETIDVYGLTQVPSQSSAKIFGVPAAWLVVLFLTALFAYAGTKIFGPPALRIYHRAA